MSSYNKPDFWSLKAKREGYPARSVYKLQEMDEKFGLFPQQAASAPFKTLDLGAAPGSWTLYALRVMGDRGFLAASDLAPLRLSGDPAKLKNVFFTQGDITAPETRDILCSHGPYNLVMSDAAPETTGNGGVDRLRSLALAEAALEYGDAALAEGGTLVLKVFQSDGAQGLLKRMRERFAKASGFKPRACRS
ncbi:MAG: RlmE family RNA methyltransferase, partial [Spirochaetaceae bacterium]|nr:RlmE family RNA methyltransferase [Spirochaetaceae bacterium]